jgi:2,4-dienoyl-CoA reductase-like NADH-dependent reductase (Old Yellow Enzyme family)/thioredoxin reductase
MGKPFQALTQPGRIGDLSIKNRMFVSAMGTNLAEAEGYVGQRIIDFHERHAKGGVGLIVLGVTGVAWPHGGNLPRQVAISDDRFIPGLTELTKAVHKHGAKIAAQLHHGGLVATEDGREGRPTWVPSYPVMSNGNFAEGFLESELAAMFDPNAPKPQLHVMQTADIDQLVEHFTQAALRAKKAGFDAVEIHGGHGYIISAFLSPRSNNRDDEYGVSLENRARLLLRIIRSVRESVGNDLALWCKIDSEEFGVEEGISLADAKAVARMAEEAGADAITVSAYHDPTHGASHSESNIPHVPERMVANAAAIKQSVSVPVIAAGRIEPAAADQHIQQGHFDFLAMGRKMLADPDLPNKISAGEPEQIRPCVYCYCCASQIYVRSALKCAVNPETGKERERALIATDALRHIAVIGGGPAGMEVAMRLDKRGFQVTLLESSNRLGGTLQFAGIAYPANERLLHWLRRQIKQSGVKVLLNTRATPEQLKRLGADEVIVATGAKRDMPAIAGADQDFVFSGDEMRAMVLSEEHPALQRKTSSFTRFMAKAGAVTRLSQSGPVVRELTKHWLPLGDRVVIIGAELVGLELAEFLAERGRRVTVIDEATKPGKGLYLVRRLRLLDELSHLGVTLLNNATDIGIGDKRVTYANYRGQERSVAVDHVIVAKGASGDTGLADEFKAAGLTTHTIGDCNGVSYIEGAIEQAAELAVRL